MEDSNVISPDLDDQIEKMENISKELNDQLKMNVSYLIILLICVLVAFCCGRAA
jgi:hypothetical protein